MRKFKGEVKVEKLITKSEFAKRHDFTRARITQLAKEDLLPEGAKVIHIKGGQIIELP